MDTNEFNQDNSTSKDVKTVTVKEHSRTPWVLGLALALALGGDAYLLVRSGQFDDKLAQMKSGTDAQISKVDAAAAALADENQRRFDELTASLHNTTDSSTVAVKKVRAEALRQGNELKNKFQEQTQEITGELSKLKDATDDASSKINDVSTDVGAVKTDVNSVKTEVASAHSELDQHSSDLKRVLGDMGVMSGLIATNSKDVAFLRELGDRNYYEFTLTKGEVSKKVGGVTIFFGKTDPKRSKYTVTVLADDKRLEKKDKTINEPVQVYVSGNRQPDEIVVNHVEKDKVTGYVATPKVTVSRR